MSHTISCDGGCGFTSSVPEDFKTLGILIEKEYCPDCTVVVSKFLAAKDELHDKLALQWSSKAGKLAVTYLKQLPGGVLPDE